MNRVIAGLFALVAALAAVDLRAQSCGELGGDYCSQNGSCPAGRHSLGTTYDCNPCCVTNTPTGPSCGQLGGNYCSQGNNCPAGYANLGGTWDCNRCCLQGGQGMSGRYYTYSQSGTDQNVLWGRGISSSDYNTYGHRYRETTTLRSPHGRVATTPGPQSTSYSEAIAWMYIDYSDLGHYIVDTQHFEWCPYVNTEWTIGSTHSWLDLGLANTCWNGYQKVPVGGRIVCAYIGMVYGCSAACVPQPGVPQHVLGEGQLDGCPAKVGYTIPYEADVFGTHCFGVGWHTDFWSPTDPCQCGNIP